MTYYTCTSLVLRQLPTDPVPRSLGMNNLSAIEPRTEKAPYGADRLLWYHVQGVSKGVIIAPSSCI